MFFSFLYDMYNEHIMILIPVLSYLHIKCFMSHTMLCSVRNKSQETTCLGDNLKVICTCPSSFELAPLQMSYTFYCINIITNEPVLEKTNNLGSDPV